MIGRVRINITLEPEVHKAALQQLLPTGISLSAFINMVLKQAFLLQPRALEESLKQVTLGFLDLVPAKTLIKKSMIRSEVEQRIDKDIKKEVKRVTHLTKK